MTKAQLKEARAAREAPNGVRDGGYRRGQASRQSNERR